MSSSLNFFICKLDARCAECSMRHVDKNETNQPVPLCEAETYKKEIKGKGTRLFFRVECSYRSVLIVEVPDAPAVAVAPAVAEDGSVDTQLTSPAGDK